MLWALGAGIDLPSLPNVSFRVRSNKRVDAPNGEGLLDLIARQKKDLGDRYPKLTTLREGQRTVGVWQGEESLVRYPDGTHSFDWVAVSRERSTLHPAWIHANMRTEVVAADKASLSDEEAIVLWDKLLEGVRFRVNAPPTQTGDMTDHNGVVATGSPKIQAP
ncbi:T6SS immunity protein Tli4 family protein [Cupriavidus necator]|uniref:T6SS immunity protein Tli4 family protein n=1 Tax=Cupriavidus necator TaxID=106590 RepID=UPI003F735FEB